MTVYNLLKSGGISEPTHKLCGLVGNVIRKWADDNGVKWVKVEQKEGDKTFMVNDYRPSNTGEMEIVAMEFIMDYLKKHSAK